jgi:hypothetical protein
MKKSQDVSATGDSIVTQGCSVRETLTSGHISINGDLIPYSVIDEVVKIFDQDLFENIQVGDHDVGLLADIVPIAH